MLQMDPFFLKVGILDPQKVARSRSDVIVIFKMASSKLHVHLEELVVVRGFKIK